MAARRGGVYTGHVNLDGLFEYSAVFPFPQGAGSKPCLQGESTDHADGAGTKPKTGKDRAHPLPVTGGVYLLTDEEDRIILLASAGNLRRAVQTRLAGPAADEDQHPGPAGRRRADLSRIVRRIRWTPACSAFEIGHLYWRLARVLMPRTYLKQLGFGPAWFVHLDPRAEIPRLAVGKMLRGPPGVDLGPFFTQGDATRFVQVLQDGFDLCRYEHILEQAPRGTPCAYFEMGRCPAPCSATIPMSRYRETVAEALAFSAGDREAMYQVLEVSMREAAARRDYEQAGRIKQRLEQLREIEHRSFALAAPIDRFNYLVVQRGGGRTRVKPFFVRGGDIAPGETVSLRKLDPAVGQWLDSWANTTSNGGQADQQSRSEQTWLVSHFLGRKDPPGLFIRADKIPDAERLAAMIRESFSRPEKPADQGTPTDGGMGEA
ncbi:MAG TPA: hypothetical protein VLM89_06910 [Phycisphaerae bacterium]|nr:hypothetical protein [Phycisphaerae bacterium]